MSTQVSPSSPGGHGAGLPPAHRRVMREAEPANSGHSGHTPRAQQPLRPEHPDNGAAAQRSAFSDFQPVCSAVDTCSALHCWELVALRDLCSLPTVDMSRNQRHCRSTQCFQQLSTDVMCGSSLRRVMRFQPRDPTTLSRTSERSMDLRCWHQWYHRDGGKLGGGRVT